jgi:Zn-dependent membrane protease YugP
VVLGVGEERKHRHRVVGIGWLAVALTVTTVTAPVTATAGRRAVKIHKVVRCIFEDVHFKWFSCVLYSTSARYYTARRSENARKKILPNG